MKRPRALDSEDGIKEEQSLPLLKKTKKEEKQSLSNLLSLLERRDSVIAGLTSFLNTVLSPEDNDEAASDLILEYLNRFPECDHLFSPLEWDQDKTFDVLQICFQCLEQVLLYTAAPPDSVTPSNHLRVSRARLVHKLLNNYMKCMYHSLRSTVPMRLVGACLKLLTAMVMQGVESAKEIQQAFNFGYKPLETFPKRTKPILSDHFESVRICWMNFCLSFLVIGDQNVITSLLELKGVLSSFFNLLPKDNIETIHLFLSTILDKVILNPEINKKTKSLFFSQSLLKQVVMLLNHSDSMAGSHDDPEMCDVVQDVTHTILNTLCTDFQLGICYRTKTLPNGLEKTNNPVLLYVLLFLSGRLVDAPARELILGTISCCPDLLLTYLRTLNLTFEPQPNSTWMVNMDFLCKFLFVYCATSLESGFSIKLFFNGVKSSNFAY